MKLRPNSRTGKGVKFGERVVPACLPHTNVVYGPHLNCTVAGWGSRGLKDPGSTRYLQSAHIPYLGIIDFTPCDLKCVHFLSRGHFWFLITLID